MHLSSCFCQYWAAKNAEEIQAVKDGFHSIIKIEQETLILHEEKNKPTPLSYLTPYFGKPPSLAEKSHSYTLPNFQAW